MNAPVPTNIIRPVAGGFEVYQGEDLKERRLLAPFGLEVFAGTFRDIRPPFVFQADFSVRALESATITRVEIRSLDITPFNADVIVNGASIFVAPVVSVFEEWVEAVLLENPSVVPANSLVVFDPIFAFEVRFS